MKDEILTVNEIAEEYKITTRTVVNWYTLKGLPYQKIGRMVRIKRSDLIAFIEGGKAWMN